MNRLILIGNGFDLAHGLKTSYKDFLIWYLANCFHKTDPWLGTYEDDLIGVRIYNINYFKDYVRRTIKPSSEFLLQEEEIYRLFNLFYGSGELCNFLSVYEAEVSELIVAGRDQRFSSHNEVQALFDLVIQSNFLRNLIINCQDCNWVDIENEYYDRLIDCKKNDGKFDREKVRQLNSEFSFLKKKLEEYLSEQQGKTHVQIIPEILTAIKADFIISDFDAVMSKVEARKKIGKGTTKGEKLMHDLYFLNFNYTETLNSYEAQLKTEMGRFNRIEINHIHGELNNSNNPIIFGFGDEQDKEYSTFEDYRNNQLFDHIKSYQYLRTPNYRNLLRFLNKDNYQVFVMGHSCGLSDRTMFKEIFEHENCKSIRLFHYNGDFHDKAINVSKHFSDKGRMRKLIVEYKETDAFPQSTVVGV